MEKIKNMLDVESMSRKEINEYSINMTIAYEKMALQLSWYEEQFRRSRAERFGPSSEHTYEGQLSFMNEAESESYGQILKEPVLDEAVSEKKVKSKGHKEKITDKLHTEVICYTLFEDEQVCPECGLDLHEMKTEVRKELTIIPAKVIVTEHKRSVYACRNCDKNGTKVPIISAPMPNPPIKNSLASASMIAHIMQRKYSQAMPLYRQEQEFKRYGINLSRQTLANWMIKSSDSWLKPLYEAMRSELLKKQVLHADETVLEVLNEPGREAKTDSYMWLYRTSSDSVPIVLYEYTPGRSGDYPKEFLKGFNGYLNTDGYAGYHKLEKNLDGSDSGILLAGCWAHARRKYTDSIKAAPKGESITLSVSSEGLAYINELFKLEGIFKDLDYEDRLIKRKEKSKKVLDEYFKWCEANEKIALPKSSLGTAINYSLKQRKYLERFMLDGRIELSNNRALYIGYFYPHLLSRSA